MTPYLPHAELEFLTDIYAKSRVILEYGAGGSTELAAMQPGKLIFSVESDRNWARAVQARIRAAKPLSQAIVYHVDIGETGAWGRPRDDTQWRRFHHYPLAIWDEPFFRHPEVVLIDGRLRTACLCAILLRITQPVTVLFDDYGVRDKYQLVEHVVKPSRLVGRMGVFELVPGMAKPQDMKFLISQFSVITYAHNREADYSLPKHADRPHADPT
jgi:hypothetical protein